MANGQSGFTRIATADWLVPADEEYLLFVAGRKRLDLEAGKQSLDLPIRQFAAFDPVHEPILSMPVKRRRADSRSGASVPKARHAPLNSSILAMRFRISCVRWSVSERIMKPIAHPFTPNNVDFHFQTH